MLGWDPLFEGNKQLVMSSLTTKPICNDYVDIVGLMEESHPMINMHKYTWREYIEFATKFAPKKHIGELIKYIYKWWAWLRSEPT